MPASPELRWELADAPRAQGELFGESIYERVPGRGEFRGMEFLHVRAGRIINEIKGPRFLSFRHTINPYRGCSHACTYCFARPSHAWLDLNVADDFDRRIVVKVNAVERLRAELAPRSWAGDPIGLGTNTDPYQRCEGKYRLTRGIVAELVERGNRFSILTKSTLVRRDLDLLGQAAAAGLVQVNLSVGTLDEAVWRATEPGTPHPRQRLRLVRQFNDAGVPCGVLVGPVIPGLSDGPDQLEAVGRASAEAGATSISTVLLHLRPGVKEHFLSTLAADFPDLLATYRRLYRGAYAPAAEQARVSESVLAAYRAAGGVAGPAFAGEVVPDGTPVGWPAAAVRRGGRAAKSAAGQLSLLDG
jgi:DNA repair photolyase